MSTETKELNGVNEFMRILGWLVSIAAVIGVLCWIFGPIVIAIIFILCIAVIGVCG